MRWQGMTIDAIRKAGFDALARNLGPVGMIRFLQHGEVGRGDYTQERVQWLGNPELRELFDAVQGEDED